VEGERLEVAVRGWGGKHRREKRNTRGRYVVGDEVRGREVGERKKELGTQVRGRGVREGGRVSMCG